jgi:dihydroxy-acid dehydratase
MKTPQSLRSYKYYSQNTLAGFSTRSRYNQLGYKESDYSLKPHIAIINTWNDLMPCHSHFPERIKKVKEGIIEAGGFPIEIPVMALSEAFQKPTTMLYRNFLAMEIEEILKSYPIDGCVLMVGCDKTTPSALMAAFSVNIPSIILPSGPMKSGEWKDIKLGAGTDTRKYWMKFQAGEITEKELKEIENKVAPNTGHCQVMGTASTMTSLAEVMGLCLSGFSNIPANDLKHSEFSNLTGKRIVDLIWKNICPKDIVNHNSFKNSIITLMALGGSTNAVIHLLAIAKRCNVTLTLEDFKKAQSIPVLADIKPSGKFLMQDFYDAGGIPVLLKHLSSKLSLTQKTVDNLTLLEIINKSECKNTNVIRTLDNPLFKNNALTILKGNLATDGAIIKPNSMDQRFLKHTGPAVVFKNLSDLWNRINDPELIVTEDSVLVLQNSGPKGVPGMPEWGNLPIPKKLIKKGVKDMLRISDARMSGTNFGACVLHISPESAIGGTLAIIKDGDIIDLDVFAGEINVKLTDNEIKYRKSLWEKPILSTTGYEEIYINYVEQANLGCDFSKNSI